MRGTVAAAVVVVGVLASVGARADEPVAVGPAGAPLYESPEEGARQIGHARPGTHVRPLSRLSGFYKVAVGRHGRVGWIRMADTVRPPARDGGARRTQIPAARTAPPAVPAPAPAGVDAAPPETPAEGAPDGGAAVLGGAREPTAPTADAPAPPLLPRLRWAWPPPWREWIAAVRAWGLSVSGVHLGVAGMLALLIVATLVYAAYRAVKWVVLLPVRAARALGRAIAGAFRRRRAAPPKVRREVADRMSEIEGMVAVVQTGGASGFSLHEAFVAAGGDDCALTAFTGAAGATESREGFPGWAGLLTDDDPVPREDLIRAWMLAVVQARAVAFLDLHPLFGGRGLHAEPEEGDDATDLGFQFVGGDALGVNLDEAQQRVYRRLETAIERARVHLSNPYAVADYAQVLTTATAEEPAEPAADWDGIPPLCTLLFGTAPRSHAGPFFHGSPPSQALVEALAQHRRSGKHVPSGPALHALAGAAPALESVVVAALSGAMSTAAATLELRRSLGAARRGALVQATAALGHKLAAWLAEPRGRERQALQAAVARALGSHHLAAARGRVEGLRALHGRDLEAEAQRWGKWRAVTITEGLLQAHGSQVARLHATVAAAVERYLTMLEELARRADDRIHQAAAGYLCAGLGREAFAEAPDAVRVAVAEAARPLKRPPGDGGPTGARDQAAPTSA